ncbi:hypothetical protein VPH35_061556 [Triticum aestivum]
MATAAHTYVEHYSHMSAIHVVSAQGNGADDMVSCHQVATTCQELMHEAVAEEHEKAGSGEGPVWKEVMERSFARLDERAANWATTRSSEEPACRCEQKMPSRCDHVGSTAVVAVVSPIQIVVANAGDSRAVLSRAGVPVALSVDHKVRACSRVERPAPSVCVRTVHNLDMNFLSLIGRTSWSASRRRAGASSTGTAPGCSASSPCPEP